MNKAEKNEIKQIIKSIEEIQDNVNDQGHEYVLCWHDLQDLIEQLQTIDERVQS